MATVIYDFETSGLSPYNDDVIEIGAKCIDNDIIFQKLVIPLSKKGISSKITEITGITNEMIKEEGLKTEEAFTLFFDYLQKLYDHFNGLTLVAHNGLHFDDIFLRRMHHYIEGCGKMQYNKMFNDIVYIDSLILCRYIHPNRKYHNMREMCMVYNITNKDAHRAMGDVNALSEIWVYLMNYMRQKHLDISGVHLKYILYYL